MKRLVSLAAVLCLGLGLAQEPQNVFVVIIDGLRNDEGFESESLYLRHIWNDLRPLGTINTSFWDRGWTATTGGHTTILSGVYQVLRNNGSNEQDIRSFDPLVCEYYRKQFTAPESSCGVVVGKWGNVGSICDFGLEPAYGEPYQGFQMGGLDSAHSDTAATRLLHQAMDLVHPRLVLLNLPDVDGTGHTGDYAVHLEAIRIADSCIYEIWKHIQAIPPYTDTFYRNRTVLIVTADHGRNDDAHGGFKGHGEWDHGCRDLIFLALGAGIAQNRVVTVPREQIDIVPTVGAMLGFPTPFAEGKVMSELFAAGYRPRPMSVSFEAQLLGAANLSNNSGFSRDPDVACDRNGDLYCVWSDSTPGEWAVFFRKSTSDGRTWTPASRLFDYPEDESLPRYCRVAADDSVAVSAMGWGRHLNRIDSLDPNRMDTTFLWYPWFATSTDAGVSWSYASLLDSNMGSYYAPVTVRNGRYGVAWWACGQFAHQSPRNGLDFNNRTAAGAWRAQPIEVTGRQSIHVAMQDDGTVYHVAASAWDGEDYDIAYCRSADAGATWSTTWVVQDSLGQASYDYDPELVVDGSGMVHLFWARKPNLGGTWQLMYGRRDVSTGLFDTARLSSSWAGAWQPHAAVKGDTICLVWIDYQDGNPELYCRFSIDLGVSWQAPERLTWSPSLTHHPRVTRSDEGFYVVWQDMAGGNWEIYGQSLAVTKPGWPGGWHEVASPPGAALVKDGGWLAFNPGNGLIYGAKGNKSSEFFAYEPVGDSYLMLAPIPDGAEGKPPRKGCDGVADGDNFVYMTKGNNTLGFWRYDISADSWEPKPDVPEGASRKRVKKGADLAWVAWGGSEQVYLLKGYGTEFYQFDASSSVWEPLQGAPVGERAKYDEGSWLCHDEAATLYGFKAKYSELWPYGLGAGAWGSQLPSMPLVGMMGKKKKPKDGSAGAWYDGSIYALKGGNTCEFWKYAPGDSWHELDTMPQLGSTGKKKRVKGGGDIVSYGCGAFFALKGNKSLEMWRYVMPLYVLRSTPRAKDGVSSGVERNAYGVMRISPNPLVGGFATVRCNPPKVGPAAVSVYDASGRCVLTRSVPHSVTGSFALDLHSLPAGVYLVRLESGSAAATTKLVVDRKRAVPAAQRQ